MYELSQEGIRNIARDSTSIRIILPRCVAYCLTTQLIHQRALNAQHSMIQLFFFDENKPLQTCCWHLVQRKYIQQQIKLIERTP